MSRAFLDHLAGEIEQIERDGLTKRERLIATPQDAVIRVADGAEVVNFCANNYLGLANHPELIAAARDFQQNVQLKEQKYDPVLTAQDQPAIHLNQELMTRLRPQMEKFYYDRKAYPTSLDQRGLKYPDVRASGG